MALEQMWWLEMRTGELWRKAGGGDTHSREHRQRSLASTVLTPSHVSTQIDKVRFHVTKGWEVPGSHFPITFARVHGWERL